ncbi:hypothetical protein RHS02_02071, partial [Rhizoctonia solani]
MTDTLKDALRPLACKWVKCSATLSSWRLLYQHYKKVHIPSSGSNQPYECCIKENQRGRLCNTGFDTYEGLWSHIKSVHLSKVLYQCPFNVNLRQLETGTHDIQDHLNEHQQLGENIVSVTPRHLPSVPLSPLPQELSFRLIAAHFPQPKSLPSVILAFRDMVVHSSYEKDSYLFGPLITDSCIEEEEDNGASSIKPRRRRLTGSLGKPQPFRAIPELEAPSLLQIPYPPRHLTASVGFDSPGFHQKAYSAFQRAELEDMDVDEA